jgi:carbonic anhydrase
MNRTYVRLASYPFPRTLMDGYKAFKSETLATDFARYRILAETGQKPDSCIISCCDSRAVPETVFSLRPGQLFVVRNVANLVPPYEADDRHHGTSAAIEFAVQGLRVRNLVVMGHGKCGGVAGFIQPASLPQRTPVLSRWMHLLEPANRRVNERRCVNSAESCSHGDSELELEVMLKKDRTGLLAEMTSAIAQANTAVVSANIHTTHNTFHIKASGWENLAQLKQSLLKIE